MALTFDRTNLTRAYKILGIKHKVRFKSNDDWWYGGYGPPVHTVSFSTTVPHDQVSHVLWHELGHVRQCDVDYGGDYTAYDQDTQPQYDEVYQYIPHTHNKEKLDASLDEWIVAYYQIPVEREAEDIAIRYSKKYPLVRY